MRGTNDFSFSGLKTAVRRLLEDRLGPDESARILRGGEVRDEPVDRETFVGQVALAFEESVVEVLVRKTVDAAAAVGARSIIVTGGVAANQRLRAEMREAASIPLFIPAPARCTDNAAMIGLAGAWALARGEGDGKRLEIQPGYGWSEIEPSIPWFRQRLVGTDRATSELLVHAIRDGSRESNTRLAP